MTRWTAAERAAYLRLTTKWGRASDVDLIEALFARLPRSQQFHFLCDYVPLRKVFCHRHRPRPRRRVSTYGLLLHLFDRLPPTEHDAVLARLPRPGRLH